MEFLFKGLCHSVKWEDPKKAARMPADRVPEGYGDRFCKDEDWSTVLTVTILIIVNLGVFTRVTITPPRWLTITFNWKIPLLLSSEKILGIFLGVPINDWFQKVCHLPRVCIFFQRYCIFVCKIHIGIWIVLDSRELCLRKLFVNRDDWNSAAAAAVATTYKIQNLTSIHSNPIQQ